MNVEGIDFDRIQFWWATSFHWIVMLCFTDRLKIRYYKYNYDIHYKDSCLHLRSSQLFCGNSNWTIKFKTCNLNRWRKYSVTEVETCDGENINTPQPLGRCMLNVHNCLRFIKFIFITFSLAKHLEAILLVLRQL